MTDANAPVIPENVVDIHSNVDKELLDLTNALYALAKTHQLLKIGLYQSSVMNDVIQAQEFVAILHGQTLDRALAHPDSDKIAKLVELKKQRSGENENGEGPTVEKA